MRKTLELKGYKSYQAFQAFHTLMLGLKMLPSYLAEDYETFFSRIEQMPPADQEKIIREAALFVELQKNEVEALACFCADPNGIPYTAENIKNLTPADIIDIIVAVCLEISKIKITLVTDTEKKS